MDNQKITVSLEEVNSSSVDNELHRQDISQRMAEHQEKIRINFGGSGEMLGVKGGLFRQAMVYMAIFGMVASLLAWGVGEIFQYKSDKHPWYDAWSCVQEFLHEYPNASIGELENYLTYWRNKIPRFRDNYFMSNEFWIELSKDRRTALIEKARNEARAYDILWYVSLATIIAIGLSIAESSVSKNKSAVIKNGIFALALGAIGGTIVSHPYLCILSGILHNARKIFCQHFLSVPIQYNDCYLCHINRQRYKLLSTNSLSVPNN